MLRIVIGALGEEGYIGDLGELGQTMTDLWVAAGWD